jgi:predicted TPR repeat methyltransferase
MARQSDDLHSLALAALDGGDGEAAAAILAQAIVAEPASSALRLDLARALVFAGRHGAALAEFDKVLALHSGRAEAHVERADLLVDLGRTKDAADGYRRALALRPEYRHAAHMLASLEGSGGGPAHAAYVAGIYDAYAVTFEDHLTRQLGYDVPGEMRRALVPLLPAPVTALDLGCGTGLVAEALGGLASPIDGIDLAPAMIAMAGRRGRYRTLAVGDVLALVGRGDFAGPYGLVTAADVFIHLPDLAAVFRRIAGGLASGGLFAFSTEDSDEPVALRSSGRYAHSPGHIRDLAAGTGMSVLLEQKVAVRLERLHPVAGRLFILRCERGERPQSAE